MSEAVGSARWRARRKRVRVRRHPSTAAAVPPVPQASPSASGVSRAPPRPCSSGHRGPRPTRRARGGHGDSRCRSPNAVRSVVWQPRRRRGLCCRSDCVSREWRSASCGRRQGLGDRVDTHGMLADASLLRPCERRWPVAAFVVPYLLGAHAFLSATSATTSPAALENAVRPPQPRSASSSDPGSRCEMSWTDPSLEK